MTVAWIVQAQVLKYSQVFPGYTSAFPLMFISSIPAAGTTNEDKTLEIVSVYVGQSPFADKPVLLRGAHWQVLKSMTSHRIKASKSNAEPIGLWCSWKAANPVPA